MTMKFKFELDVQHAAVMLDALTAVHWLQPLLWRSPMKTITLAAIALSLACSAASAQDVEVTEQRYTKDRLVTTNPDGGTEETTRRHDGRGTTTYTITDTTTRTPAPVLPAPVQLSPRDDAADFSAVVENLPRTNSLRSSLYTAADDTVANADAVPRTNSLRSSFYTAR